MAVGTTNYPTALDTVLTLIEAANNATSTLNGAIDNSVTTITVASTTGFAASGVIAIENELISYTAKTATDFTGCVRGFEATTAASHANTTAVEQIITARSHNVIASAIIATQTKLGYGSDTPANGQVMIGNGAGTSEWRALIAGDIPDLSGTYQPVDADLTAIAALSSDGLLRKTSGTWGMDATAYGTGTVTSVALSVPGFLSVSGSPVTTSGTLAVSLADQNENLVFAGPATAPAAAPTFRALVAADIPGVLSITKASNLTSNGFVKTSGGDGTLSVDTSTYLTGNQSISLSGDVTGSGTTAITATIANDAVTYAKLQNVSATSRILGRKTASAGDAEECTLSEVLDFIGSAAQGDILYRGASAWERLGAGTSGHYLQTQGAGANPQWAAVAGGGGLTVGTTAITSGTAGRILYEATGNVLGEAAGITYQTGASPTVTITAQAASYIGLRVITAATPSTDVFQVSADNGTTAHFKVTSTGAPSSPGAGANSERYGSGALAAGTDTVAVGNGASASGAGNVAIGQGASATTNNGSVAIGDGAAAGNGAANTHNVAIGIAASAAGGIALGRSSAAIGSGSFVAGSSAAAITDIYFGNGINGGSTAFTIRGTQGSGTNAAGASMGLAGGRPSGNANPGSVYIEFSRPGASGSAIATTSDEWRMSYAATDTVRLAANIKTSTTTLTSATAIDSLWTDATHASRTSALTFSTVNNAGALTEQARLDGPGRFIHNHVYGGLYEDGGSTAITITSAGTYYQWTTATAGLTNGITASTGSDNLTVDAGYGGTYLITLSVSFSGTANATIKGAVYINGARAANGTFVRKMGTGGDIGAASLQCVAAVSAGQTVDLRFTSDGNGDTVTPSQVNLTMSRIGA